MVGKAGIETERREAGEGFSGTLPHADALRAARCTLLKTMWRRRRADK